MSMFTSTPYITREEDQTIMVGSLSLRQSISRGRQSYAYPLQQVFEETRSMLTHDGGRSVVEPSEFETTLGRNRRMTLGATMYEVEDFLSAIESLHVQFGLTVQSMTDRSQIFEVVNAWLTDLGIASMHQKTNQSDISDANFRKLQNLLCKETETWNLIRHLYFERLHEDNGVGEPFSGEIRDKFCINEALYVEAIIGSNPALREDRLKIIYCIFSSHNMFIILSWLEANFEKNGPPDLTEKFFIWENTWEALKRDRLVNRPSSKSMVTNIDPDAITREAKQLHPLDDEENNKVLRGSFFYLRTGNNDNAIAYLAKSGDKIKAAALSGFQYTSKTQIDPETGEEQEARRHVVLPSMEYLPRAKRQARPSPDFDIRGNQKRDLWKYITWRVCEKNAMSKFDRALLGTVCGHRPAMLDVAHTWEDRLWAFMKASIDVSVEGELRSASNPNNRKELPESYWSQKLSVHECIEKVEAFERQDKANTPDHIFQLLQKCVMTDKLDLFLEELQLALGELLEAYDHPLLKGHLIRFLTHLLLFFGIVNLPYSQELIDVCTEHYISVLVDINHFTKIPFYVQKLSDERKIPIIVHHVNLNNQLSKEDIAEFLQAAHENDLDILNIGISIVDKMRDEEGDFKVENLNWISSCYDILERSPQVMIDLLKYTIWISRKYLTLGNIRKVQQLIGRLTTENISEVGQMSDSLENTLVREYICYKVYLTAEDALALWKKAMSQRPTLDTGALPTNSTSADRTIFDKKKKEQEMMELKWRRAIEYHLNTAIKMFLEILKFPLGWLRECYDPLDEDESIHVGAVRRIVIRKVVHILLRLVQDKNDNRTFRDFIYVLCDEKRNIRKELSSEEIANIFKVVEQFTRQKVSNIMFLPK